MKVELRGVTKRFPGVVANQRVDLTVASGEVHALLGENGAGKSTLMNVLFGAQRPDEGRILVDGRDVSFASPADAIATGIGMVHQHFMLVPVLTVTENLMLGNEQTTTFGRLDMKAARRRVIELSTRYGLEVDPDAIVGDLPLGVQQRVEVLKALYRDADCLILDEPTAVLTPSESTELETVLRNLASSGRSIIFISHKLREALRVADKITVLRQGEVVATMAASDTDEHQLATLMVGRPLDPVTTTARIQSRPSASDDDRRLESGTRLAVERLVVSDDRGKTAVDHASFELIAGEILAIAGVQGNGQSELVEALTGLRAPKSGTVRLDGRDVTGASPGRLARNGVGHVPEDRTRVGLVGQFSLADNLVLNSFNTPQFSFRGVRRRRAVRDNAEKLKDEFDIRATSTGVAVSTLSGGNQQKVVLAREIGHASKLLVAAQPTRGLDVGSIRYVHRRLLEQRDSGAAILLVSSDLDEVLTLADRIAVMVGGRIVGIVDRDSADRDVAGRMMAGLSVGGDV